MLRDIAAVVKWEEGLISFWLTLFFLVIGILLLVLPAVTILHWSCRIFIWVCLGPWLRIYREIATDGADFIDMRSKDYIDKFSHFQLENFSKKFERKGRAARLKGEEAAKLKAMRTYSFGKHIVNIPSMGITRWYDYPLSESSAAQISVSVEPKKIVDSQHLEGKMIPRGETTDVEKYVGKDDTLIDSFVKNKGAKAKATAMKGLSGQGFSAVAKKMVTVRGKKFAALPQNLFKKKET